MHRTVPDFPALLATPLTGGVNALRWERALPGDYAEVMARLGPGEGIVTLDEDRLRALDVSPAGRTAIDHMLADLQLLRDAGRDPALNCVYGYPRDDTAGAVATDVFSYHADSAPVEADTWLCTYHGACSEGLLNRHALRKVDDPATRAALLREYGGPDDAAFAEWLADNHYDLHYAARPGAQPYIFGRFNLWRITVDWPGNRPPRPTTDNAPSPPCVHRAPTTDAPRLLLIS